MALMISEGGVILGPAVCIAIAVNGMAIALIGITQEA